MTAEVHFLTKSSFKAVTISNPYIDKFFYYDDDLNKVIEELKKDCADSRWHFPKTIRRPRVAHFCERKPLLFDRHTYSRPFTIARLEHLRRKRGELGAWLAVLNEERHVLVGKSKRRLQRAGGNSV